MMSFRHKRIITSEIGNEHFMFALADCNNFYVSCERLFRPDLVNRAVIVLSNNDGCVISRSNEAKALGIAMGAPFFKIKAFCQQHQVNVFSSNYSLYADLSQRVATVLESFSTEIELYSIDEAFLRFRNMRHESLLRTGELMQKTVRQWTGIPISVGLGETKTLAKLASFIAKKYFKQSLFYLSSSQYHDHLLARVPVGELWGVGRRWQKRLERQGIHSALDLKKAATAHIRQEYGVVLERTCRELQGYVCLELESVQAKKNIVSSRSFGCKQTKLEPIAQALSLYTSRACEKLRAQHSVTACIHIFLMTNRFNNKHYYQNSVLIHLPHLTNDTRMITHYAKQGLNKIFRKGFEYQKVGIMLLDLLPSDRVIQQDLFADYGLQDPLTNQIHPANQSKQTEKLMKVLDQINQRMGKNTLVTAAQGFKQVTAMRREYCSPCYTTSWADLVRINDR